MYLYLRAEGLASLFNGGFDGTATSTCISKPANLFFLCLRLRIVISLLFYSCRHFLAVSGEERQLIPVILVSFGPVAPGTIYPPEINGFVSPE